MASKLKTKDFKILEVKKSTPIKKFLNDNDLEFVKGNAYYQLTKPEVIQNYKNIIVMKKDNQSLITGDEKMRTILNIPKNAKSKKITIQVEEIKDFLVFIQSTSYNRKLISDTKLLYYIGKEVDDDEEPDEDKETDADEETEVDKNEYTSKALKRKSTTKPEDKSNKTPKVISQDRIDIAFSFDTTGSMYPCIKGVRREMQNIIRRLKNDIPGIRMAVIAHGDYCDARSSYVTKHCNFTDNENELCKFVANVGCTGGGDFDECYELVLRESHTKLNWRTDSVKSLVIIGDATPHDVSYKLNDQNIDWKQECDTLKEKGIKIYSVQALNQSDSNSFYKEMASRTEGYHLNLDQFSSMANFMIAICYHENSDDQLNNFRNEIHSQNGLNRELHRLFDNLSGQSTTYKDNSSTKGLIPVDASKFQILKVDRKCSIKEFVQENHLIFQTGKGFYEFTKPEKISDKKRVVLVDKSNGDMFTGEEAFKIIGAGGWAKIQPKSLEKYRIFVQSTSYNRVLLADTGFLYEVDTSR